MKTLGDGNCAFNAFSLGLFQLFTNDRLRVDHIPEEFFKKASYNVVKWPPIEKVEKERRSLSSLAVFCGGYPHLFMLPA